MFMGRTRETNSGKPLATTALRLMLHQNGIKTWRAGKDGRGRCLRFPHESLSLPVT